MLTDKGVRATLPKDKPFKLADSGGLFLHVAPTGYKSWRFKYRLGGKEQLLTFGRYPDVSLADARELRNEARKQLRAGSDPRHAARRARLIGANEDQETFETVAKRWHDKQRGRWKPVHANDVITSLERDIFPKIGNMPLDQIDRRTLVAVLRKIEARGAIETAHRIKQRVAKIYQFANAEGGDFVNPAADINEALAPVPPAQRYPALVRLSDIREIIAKIDRAGASPVTRLASRLLALTAQRPGMIRLMQWEDVAGVDWADLTSSMTEAMWIVPASKMKQELHLRRDDAFNHPVPLSRQAVDVLRAIRLFTEQSKFVFPSIRSGTEPMSGNAIGYLYNREKYKDRHVPHGWRSSFSTIMNEMVERKAGQDERMLADRLIVDLMLAHTPKGMSATELRYNRAAYLPRRRELAQQWADLIMEGAMPLAEIMESPRRKPRD
ncbi:MAG: integrase [Pelagerythrobacter marensis]|nr:MAG: integrase [Pelagerythrobacter marensis]